jgi:hypothetical protein
MGGAHVLGPAAATVLCLRSRFGIAPGRADRRAGKDVRLVLKPYIQPST